MEMTKKMMVLSLSFLISSLVKIRLSEMITPAVPIQKKKTKNENLVFASYTNMDFHEQKASYSLRSSHPVCSAWEASPCIHRNWTAAL